MFIFKISELKFSLIKITIKFQFKPKYQAVLFRQFHLANLIYAKAFIQLHLGNFIYTTSFRQKHSGNVILVKTWSLNQLSVQLTIVFMIKGNFRLLN